MFIVSKPTIIHLNGTTYLLEEGDRLAVGPMFPIRYALRAAKMSGIDPSRLKLLGSGENGYAFALDDSVIKITSDKKEYENAKKLSKLNTKHVVDVYNASKVEMNLTRVPDWWVKYWGSAMPGWDTLNQLYVIHTERVNAVDEDLLDGVINQLKTSKHIPQKHRNLAKQLQNLINEIKSAGIKMYDIRGGNIGVRDGTIKLFDLGGSL